MRSINVTKNVLVLLVTMLVLIVVLMMLYFINNINLTHASNFTKPVYSNENKLYTYFDDYGYYNLEIAGNTWFNSEANDCYTPLSYNEEDITPTFLSSKNTRNNYINIGSRAVNDVLVLTDKLSFTYVNRNNFINTPCYEIWSELDKGTPNVFFDKYFTKTSDGYYNLSPKKYPFKHLFSLKKIPISAGVKTPYKTSSKLNVEGNSNIKKAILTFAVTIFNPKMSTDATLTLKIIAPSGKEYNIDVFNENSYYINYEKIKAINEENILSYCDIIPTENKEECLEAIESVDLSKASLLDFYVGTIDITDIINAHKGGSYKVEINSNLTVGKTNNIITSFPIQADWQITAIEENKEKVKDIKYARIDSGNVSISGGETKEFKFNNNNNLDINGKSKFSIITSDGDKNENDSLINYKNEMLEIEGREKNDFFNSTAYDITNSTKYMYGMDAFNKTFNSSNLIDTNGLSFKIKKENNDINDKLYLRNIALISDVKKPNINITADVNNRENISINLSNTGANLCDEELSITLDKNIIDVKNLTIKGNCDNNNIKYDKNKNTIEGSINLNNGCSLNINFSVELKDKKEESKIISKVIGKAEYDDKCYDEVKTEKSFIIGNNENTVPLSASIKYTSEKIISNVTTHNNTSTKKCNCKMFIDIDKNIEDIENIMILRKLNNNQTKEISDYKLKDNILEINIGTLNEDEKIEVTYDNIINNFKITNLNARLEYYESNGNICDNSNKENIKISTASDFIDLSKYIDVPITDSYKSYILYIIGALLIFTGIALIIYYKKFKHKNRH